MHMTAKDISYLGLAFTDRTELSFFTMLDDVETDGSEHVNLIEKGVFSGDSYSPEALAILTVLEQPERCSRLILQNGIFSVEKYTYKKDDSLVLVEASKQGYVFSKPDSPADAVLTLADFVSFSNITMTEFDINLDVAEGMVLTAIIDWYRRNALAAFSKKQSSFGPPELKDIESEFEDSFEASLLYIICKAFNFDPINRAEIEKALQSLIDKSYILKEDDGNRFLLNTDFGVFASTFLIPECFILYETFSIKGPGEVGFASNYCVTGGTHNTVVYSYSGSAFGMKTMSAANLLRHIEGFLNCPDLEKNPGGNSEGR